MTFAHRSLSPAALFVPAPGGGGGAPLDGLGATGAWSFSRDLLTAWGGAARYTEAAGKIDALKDQSGNVRDLTQVTAGNRPTIGSAGPNLRTCGVFVSASSTMLDSAAGDPLSDFLTAAAGYMIVSFLADTVDANNASVWLNEGIVSDTSQILGLCTKVGPLLFAYSWDGTSDSVSAAIATGAVRVAEWRHDGGNLFLRLNGAGEVSVASGNVSGLSGRLRIGGSGVGSTAGGFDGKIFELATFAAVPAGSVRDALAADFMAHVGA